MVAAGGGAFLVTPLSHFQVTGCPAVQRAQDIGKHVRVAVAGARFVRTSVKLGLIVCLGLAILAGLLMLPFVWGFIEAEAFYRARPLLQDMRLAYGGDSAKSALARDVLLTRFPIGAEASSAVAALSRDGFGCQKISSSPMRPGTLAGALQERAEELRDQLGAPKVEPEPTRMDCQLLAPAQFGYTRWIINLPIDNAGRLIGAKVAIWHILL